MKLPKIIKLPVSNTQTECYFTKVMNTSVNPKKGLKLKVC